MNSFFFSSFSSKFLHLLQWSDGLKIAVPPAPVMTFSQPSYLKSFPCRAKRLDPSKVNFNTAIDPCRVYAKNRCQICDLLVCSDLVMSTSSGKKFQCENYSTTCDSFWVFYIISCPVCQFQYFGRTNNFRLMINGRKRDIRRFRTGT